MTVLVFEPPTPRNLPSTPRRRISRAYEDCDDFFLISRLWRGSRKRDKRPLGGVPPRATSRVWPRSRDGEADFINFMDLEMSRGDKAIALLSGDGGGVIKPIANRDEEVARGGVMIRGRNLQGSFTRGMIGLAPNCHLLYF